MRPLVLLTLTLLPATAPADAANVIRSGSSWIEVLPARAAPPEMKTPEGFLRLEGPQAASAGSGSFSVAASYRASPPAAPPPQAVEMTARTGGAVVAQGAAGEVPCRAERDRYLRRLLAMQGIDLDHPIDFLEGLGGSGSAGALLFTAYGFLPGFDPIRPLSFDLEARSLARELAACARGLRR